ncbi:EscU/YscU/HrcU family type III secretion system export apparatus switch protein [Buchnera aphidicola (Takecallis taiwana)]|uniref:EscU/YscU/HrcU family type III secretion system export apparatus switch protein n=1 Tax=Buchnera aphidicola TaxID=9 RepID=UPI0031B671B5
MQSDVQEKTEKPTDYRIQQAKKNGLINYSREFSSFLIFISGMSISYVYGWNIVMLFIKLVIFHLSFSHSIIQNNFFFQPIITLNIIVHIIVYFFYIYFIALVITYIIFNGFVLKLKFIKLRILNINIYRCINNIFSYDLYINFLTIFFKIVIICLIYFFYLKYFFLKIMNLIFLPNDLFFQMSLNIILSFILFVLIGFIPIVVFDILRNKFRYYNHLHMTYQEIKDEYKDNESKKDIINIIKNNIHR